MSSLPQLLKEIKRCTVCKESLPHAPNPVVQFSEHSKIIIIGQAPGRKVHESGIPWNDESGKRLREWLDVDETLFYDTQHFAIVPMGFCYPGKGKSGDLPPRKECAPLWMEQILNQLKSKKTLLLVGQYSQEYFLPSDKNKTLTERVKNWKDYFPEHFLLPHPSPRNNIWMKKNPWFQKKVLPFLRDHIKNTLSS